MEYMGKKIWEERPGVSDDYRVGYVRGIETYIQKMNEHARRKRRNLIMPEQLVQTQEFYREKYRKMIGLKAFAETSQKPTEMVFVGSDQVCRIYRCKVYLADEIPFYSMLLIPHNVKEPMPLVIAQHGGGGTPELCCDMNGPNNYNHMAQRCLARGAAVLAPQLLLWNLEEQEKQRGHNIPYNRGRVDEQLKRFGTSITALEISGIMRSLDHVCGMKEIDEDKIGMIGLSYGGYFTLHTMAADIRIKAGYVAAAFNDRDVYGWGNWTYKDSAYLFQDAEVAALCVPRKLYILVGKEDAVFDYRSAIPEAEYVKNYFEAFGKQQNYLFRVWDGAHTVADDEEGYDFIFEELNG